MLPLPRLKDLPGLGAGPLAAPGRLDVDVWSHNYDVAAGPERTSFLLAFLPPEEQAAADRLLDRHRRQRFLVGRVLCRLVLSRYVPVAPQEWRLSYGARGKPFVSAPASGPPLWFNLSHSDGMSLCAVTGAGPDIGIDVERVERGAEALDIAEQFFPEPEATALRLTPSSQRGEMSVCLWALKESFAKAREASLETVIAKTIFDLSRLDDLRAKFPGSQDERPEDWRFRLFRIDSRRIVAVAVRTPTHGPLSVSVGTCPELR